MCRSVVIGYGKQYWDEYASLFPGLAFGEVNSFAVATTETSIVVLTDHFTARTMNNRFQDVVALIQLYYSNRTTQ